MKVYHLTKKQVTGSSVEELAWECSEERPFVKATVWGTAFYWEEHNGIFLVSKKRPTVSECSQIWEQVFG